MAESTTIAADVPWVDPFRFCFQPDSPASVSAWFEQSGWRKGIVAWLTLPISHDDPFAVVAKLILDGRITAGRAMQVFFSICDHRRAGFDEKKAIFGSWADASASLGPSGDTEADLLLWRTAWGYIHAVYPPAYADIHWVDIGELFRVLNDQHKGTSHAGFKMCDAFLGCLPTDFDQEVSEFATATLRDKIVVEGKAYDTYKGLFGAILELMAWPAMVGNARMRIESSLLGVACERRTSYAISQDAL